MNHLRRGALTWQPITPDLNAPDYYLWGYLNERVYIDRPEILKNLKNNTNSEIRAISPAPLRSVIIAVEDRT